jgi:hypothetical protein
VFTSHFSTVVNRPNRASTVHRLRYNFATNVAVYSLKPIFLRWAGLGINW